MNLANKITVVRVILIPIYVMCMMVSFPYHYLNGGAIFIFASLTDLVDGYIARKYDMVTDFGKFVDPLADKLLVISSMMCFIDVGYIAAWMGIIVVLRELAVTSLRTLAASKDVVIAADKYGKLKTSFQMFALIAYHFAEVHSLFMTAGNVLFYIALALTVFSGINYFLVNRKVFETTS